MDNDWNDPDDGVNSAGVGYRQDCLYAQGIPDVVNSVGLERAFAKFGTVIEFYVSPDPARRYALVTFQTHEEANRALVGLNNTPPLNLNVRFAIDKSHQKGNRESGPKRRRPVADNGYANQELCRPSSRDNMSTSSSGRHRNVSEQYEDELQLEDPEGLLALDNEEMGGLDVDLFLKMKELELIQATRSLKRAKAMAQMSGEYTPDRYMTPDNRIIVKTRASQEGSVMAERRVDSPQPGSTILRDPVETKVDTELGDYFALPALSQRHCVTCNAAARFICTSCDTTPYCSEGCQRSDFTRHRSICHNLKSAHELVSGRSMEGAGAPHERPPQHTYDGKNNFAENQTTQNNRPLLSGHNRRPDSGQNGGRDRAPQRRPQEQRRGDNHDSPRGRFGDGRGDDHDAARGRNGHDAARGRDGHDASRGRFGDGHDAARGRDGHDASRGRFGDGHDAARGRDGHNVARGRDGHDAPRGHVGDGHGAARGRFGDGHDAARGRDGDSSFRGRANGHVPGRRPPLRHETARGEEFGGGDAPSATQAFPRFTPQKTRVEEQTLPTVKTASEAEVPTKESPKPKEVPEHYVLEEVTTGTLMSLMVIGLEGRGGHLCVAMSTSHRDQYTRALCDELGNVCDADTCDITAAAGEVVCVRDPADGCWYRARCLGGADGGSAVLLDAARLLPLRGVSCRKMPQQYRDIPEFNCVLETKDDVKIGESYDCTAKSKAGDAVTWSIKTEAGVELRDVRISRWRPPVHKPQPSVEKPQTSGGNTFPSPTPQKTPVEDKTPAPATAPVKETIKVKEVPEHYVPEVVTTGTVMSLEVIGLEGRGGHLCVAFSTSHGDQYTALCDELGNVCDADTCDITATAGEVVCVRDPADGCWYRARCLGGADGGSAALLDAARLLPLRGVSCRKMPQQYRDIPEFNCVLETKIDVKIGESYVCTAKSKVDDVVMVSIKTGAGVPLGDVRIARWRPPVHKPQPSVEKPETSASTSAALPNRYRRLLKKPQEETEAPTKKASPSVAKLLPEKYVLDTLSPGEDVTILSVSYGEEVLLEASQSLCLCVTVALEVQYGRLVGEMSAACNVDTVDITPAAGELVCVRDPTDGDWYRARCLGGGLAALIDAQKVLALSGVPCRRVPDAFTDIPEFSCVVQSDIQLQVGEAFLGKVQSVSGGVVTLSDASKVGRCTRWRPPVRGAPTELPVAAPPAASSAQSTAVVATVMESYSRPELRRGAQVVLVGASAAERVCVVSTESEKRRAYDAVLTDVAVCGQTAPALTVPPGVGALVLAQRADGNHYRAAVLKKKESLNKYLLEFLELGVEEKSSLERMRACPEMLAPSARPALASLLRLHDVAALSEDALAYLDALKESATPLVLGLPSGAASEPSGAAATIVNARTNQSVNARVHIISKPSWKKMEEDGQSVLKLAPLTLEDVEYVQLPEGGAAEVELRVLDAALLSEGLLTACRADEPVLPYVTDVLPRELEAYCSSAVGREPYLPRPNELCIAKFPEREAWCRALAADQPGGPGEPLMQLVSLDHAHVSVVEVRNIRKMLPEFVRKPAVGLLLSVAGFPVSPSVEVVSRAREFLAGGTLRARKCRLTEVGEYTVEAPALIAALTDVD